jgi:hypothetical protein
MTESLADPPPTPLPPLDIRVPGGRLRQLTSGLVELAYDGLPVLPSWPHDTPEKRAEAADVAGGDLFLANLQHELIHCLFLPRAFGWPHSPQLHALAQYKAGLRPDYHRWWGFEETAVLAMRRYATLLGVDLVRLAVEAAEREEQSPVD